MKLADLEEYVDHFRHRVMQDALATATADYWRRRADTFKAAMPREGDFTGRATPEEINEQRMRVAIAEQACRRKSIFMLGGEVE